ncbi:glycosyltransferase family 2 protein [Roseinatronobacter sp.]|uniref:glycosyltransferase family 2 protein n=1 Tax=Roseinatronobacter sp. TaxID=1945755 RepID=UPI0025EC1B34|nr:glycosyltransferase family 2 protein [Roseibaca sp.]
MNIVAVLAIRNEKTFLANALQHLIDNGIRYAILDNESDDGGTDILREPRFKQNLVHFETLPYPGHFDLIAQLEAKQRLYDELDADWLMHLDADEIVHSYRAGERLDEAIARIAATGADAINFDEFVFLPVDHAYIPDHDGPQPMRHYYYFDPGVPQKINAWRAALRPNKVKSGGHKIHGAKYVLAEEALAMRHYMFTDQDHAYRKYTQRRFAEAELKRGWHVNRAGAGRMAFRFPPKSSLLEVSDPSDRSLRRDTPKPLPYWQWGLRAWVTRKAKGLVRRLKR